MDRLPTLLVRRLPGILSSTETEDLLRHFGSQSVYVFPPKSPMVSKPRRMLPVHVLATKFLYGNFFATVHDVCIIMCCNFNLTEKLCNCYIPYT